MVCGCGFAADRAHNRRLRSIFPCRKETRSLYHRGMLLGLTIRDVVLIDRLSLAFRPGLCVLTGETGAGKSILLDALGLALGRRAEALHQLWTGDENIAKGQYVSRPHGFVNDRADAKGDIDTVLDQVKATLG